MKTNILKKKAKMMSFCIAAMMVSCMLCNNVNAETGYALREREIQSIMEERRPLYNNDPLFNLTATERGLSFDELLREKAERILVNREAAKKIEGTRGIGNYGNNLFANIPLIQQPTTYTCGPTSALQVIYGFGKQNSVTGSTDLEKINTLATEACTTNQTYVGNLVTALNLHTPTYGSYEYIYVNNLTQAQFQSKVETSLAYDLAPILHAQTSVLPYYGGHSSGHYIAVSELDKINGTMTVKDCNYTNAYYGVHTESISAFYACLSGRYLICYEY